MLRTLQLFAAVHKAGETCSFNNTISDFLGFPHWYQYLPGTYVSVDSSKNAATVCNPSLQNLSDIWLIAAAIIEILVRLAAIAAIGYVIYGGIMYITSEGNPEKTGKAKQTIVNALVGLMLSVFAASIIAFLAGSIN